MTTRSANAGAPARTPVFRQMRVAGYNLRVAVWPGAPSRVPILLFNGIGGNLELLSPFVDALGDTEVICFDMPGAGGSMPPRSFYRLPAMAHLTAKLLWKLGRERVDVVGISWGGALAQQFAHSEPAHCRRLVLCATMAGPPLAWPAAPGVLMKLMTPMRYIRHGYMRREAGTLYGGRFRHDRALVRDYISRIRKPHQLGYLAQLFAISGWTSAPWLWRLPQPTLVLGGADDPIAPPLNARLLAALIPDSRLQIIDGGHLFVVAQPMHAAGLVRTFLDSETPPLENSTCLDQRCA